LVLTKLDFGNATLAGFPSFQLDRRQVVMNAAARLMSSRQVPCAAADILQARRHGDGVAVRP